MSSSDLPDLYGMYQLPPLTSATLGKSTFLIFPLKMCVYSGQLRSSLCGVGMQMTEIPVTLGGWLQGPS